MRRDMLEPARRVRGCLRTLLGCGCILLVILLVILLGLLIWGLARVASAEGPDDDWLVVPLVPIIVERPSLQGEAGPRVFYEREITFTYCGGPAWLASQPNLDAHPLRSDDELWLESLAPQPMARRLNFQSPSREAIVAQPGPLEVTDLLSPGVNRLRVRVVDLQPPVYSSGPYWLIVPRCPQPTATPLAIVRSTEQATPLPRVSPIPTTLPTLRVEVKRPTQIATPRMFALMAIEEPTQPLWPTKMPAPLQGGISHDKPGFSPVRIVGIAVCVGVLIVAWRIAVRLSQKRAPQAEPSLYGTLFLRSGDGSRTMALLENFPQGCRIFANPLRVEPFTSEDPSSCLAEIRPTEEGPQLLADGVAIVLQYGQTYTLPASIHLEYLR